MANSAPSLTENGFHSLTAEPLRRGNPPLWLRMGIELGYTKTGFSEPYWERRAAWQQNG